MIEARRHIPFSEHIAHFPGEPKPDNFRLAVSAFAHDAELSIDSERMKTAEELIGTLTNPETRSKERYNARQRLADFCMFQENINVIQPLTSTYLQLAESAKEDADSNQLQRYRALATVVENLTRTPDNVDLQLYLLTHAVEKREDYEIFKNQILGDMRHFFSRDAHNIILLEQGATHNAFTKGIERDFKQFGSLVRARANQSFKFHRGRLPTQTELDSLTAKFEEINVKGGNSDQMFGVMLAAAVDELIAEGYVIEPEWEEGGSEYNVNVVDGDTKETFLKMVTDMRNTLRIRDPKIAMQLIRITRRQQNEAGDTKIFAVFGGAHGGIEKHLPDNIRKTVAVVDRSKSFEDKMDDLIYKVMSGIEMPDEELDEAYNVWKQAITQIP